MEQIQSNTLVTADGQVAVAIIAPAEAVEPVITWKTADWLHIAATKSWGSAVNPAQEKFLESIKDLSGAEIANLYVPPKSCHHCAGTGLYGFKFHKKSNQICTYDNCKVCPKCLKYSVVRTLSHSKECIHNCGFKWTANLVKTLVTSSEPRTQKVKGLKALANQSLLQTNKFFVLQEPETVADFDPDGMFIRPCPKTPRHGFVESRVCKDKAELKKVWDEARAADPEAELIAMDLIEAKASGILIAESGALALGPGHDGATAGKKSLILPISPIKVVSSTDEDEFGDIYHAFPLKEIREQASIKADDHTYLELVYRKGSKSPVAGCFAVQARSGPPMATSKPDFIPMETKVTEILTPTDDLLEWEKLVVEKRGVPGVVAYQKNATLACHAAVHCVAAGIPFVTTKKPKIGQTLKANVEVAEFNQLEFQKGLTIGWTTGVGALKAGVTTAVAILHNSSFLVTSKHWPRLYGYMAAVLFKAAALACIGESRHKSLVSGVAKTSRTGAWNAYSSYSPRWIAQKIGRLVPAFLDSCWNDSYGGFKWAHCCVEVARLYKAMAEGDRAKVLMAANNVVNTSHNNGKLLTKFAPSATFDAAARMPGILLSQCGAQVYKVLARRSVKKLVQLKPYMQRAARYKMSAPKPDPNGNPLARCTVSIKIPTASKSGITTTTRQMTWGMIEDPVYEALINWQEEL